MNAVAKLLAFAVLLGFAFGGAALAGAAIDPTGGEETAISAHGVTDESHGETGPHQEQDSAPEHLGTDAAPSTGEHAGTEPPAGGLAVSESGYALKPDRTHFEAGRPARFSFAITDARGRVVGDEFEPEHERELHLIVVRRDTAIYRHLHPRKGTDGSWSVQLELPEPGVYRAYADFQIAGQSQTLATDLFAPGEFRPEPLPGPASRDASGGYDVELDAAGTDAGQEGELTFAVTRDGRPAEDLQDYLGAKGHLVALREGDLAYLHVHPTDSGAHAHGGEAAPAHANDVPFAATFPTAGRYRLFFQFKTDGEVRTVAYTLEVPR